MQIKNEYTLLASHKRVWGYFTDSKLLRQCIPGCEELKPVDDDVYEATIKVGEASLRGTYKRSVKIENKQPPSAYRLIVEGKSTIGFLKGTCDFRLEKTEPD